MDASCTKDVPIVCTRNLWVFDWRATAKVYAGTRKHAFPAILSCSIVTASDRHTGDENEQHHPITLHIRRTSRQANLKVTRLKALAFILGKPVKFFKITLPRAARTRCSVNLNTSRIVALSHPANH